MATHSKMLGEQVLFVFVLFQRQGIPVSSRLTLNSSDPPTSVFQALSKGLCHQAHKSLFSSVYYPHQEFSLCVCVCVFKIYLLQTFLPLCTSDGNEVLTSYSLHNQRWPSISDPPGSTLLEQLLPDTQWDSCLNSSADYEEPE